MKNDEWCEFCNEKLKSVKVILKGREYDVCHHCESLTTSEEREELFVRNK
jgi:ribosome-binding protein aMBF1 (putative translation factor)